MINLSTILFITLLSTTYSLAPYYYDYGHYFRSHWKGAIQPDSIHFKIFPNIQNVGGLNTFIVVYTKAGGSPVPAPSSLANSITFAAVSHPVGEMTVTGLTPATQYYYTLVLTQDSVIDPATFQANYNANVKSEFRFRTFPAALTPYSFGFGAASCADTGSENAVFQYLIDSDFDFFLHMGDLHYEDIDVNDENLFYEAYYKVWASPIQKRFFQNVPVYYNWDDHDFGPNDAEGTSPSRPAVTAAYKRFAPYPANLLKNRLPAGIVDPNDGTYLSYNSDGFGIFRSFVVGRCVFIQLDLRTYKDVIPGDLLGEEQRSWFENQIRYAGRTPEIKMVFMISSVPWVSKEPGAVWGDYGVTQDWIGGLITRHIYANNKEAMMIAGDAHMVAFDDGRNNNRGGFPVVQAASLDRWGSCKGGPYSHGTNPERGQYASFRVSDNGGDKICVNIKLKRYGVNVINYDTCNPHIYPLSEDPECPSKFMIWIRMFPGAIYIMIFGCIFVFACICVTVFCCRRRRLRRKAALKKKQEEEAKQKEDNYSEKEKEPVKPEPTKEDGHPEQSFTPPASEVHKLVQE